MAERICQKCYRERLMIALLAGKARRALDERRFGDAKLCLDNIQWIYLGASEGMLVIPPSPKVAEAG